MIFTELCIIRWKSLVHQTLETNQNCRWKHKSLFTLAPFEFWISIWFNLVYSTIKFKVFLMERYHSERRGSISFPLTTFAWQVACNTLKCWQSSVCGIQYEINAYADVMNAFSCMRTAFSSEMTNFQGTHTDSNKQSEYIENNTRLSIQHCLLVCKCVRSKKFVINDSIRSGRIFTSVPVYVVHCFSANKMPYKL